MINFKIVFILLLFILILLIVNIILFSNCILYHKKNVQFNSNNKYKKRVRFNPNNEYYDLEKVSEFFGGSCNSCLGGGCNSCLGGNSTNASVMQFNGNTQSDYLKQAMEKIGWKYIDNSDYAHFSFDNNNLSLCGQILQLGLEFSDKKN